MFQRSRVLAGVTFAIAASVAAGAQEPLSSADLARADTAVREAFAFLYALPSDTAGAPMGSWVIDSAAVTASAEQTGRWRIVVTKLTDTGEGLRLKEMLGEPGTSPAQLASAMEAMQRLESKISKAEAEAAIEVEVVLNAADTGSVDRAHNGERSRPAIAGAERAVLVNGYATKILDREVGVEHEQWTPATLMVRFGATTPHRSGVHSVTVTARGNTEMIHRVIGDTRWTALAKLIN